jgi:hypothetical protein
MSKSFYRKKMTQVYDRIERNWPWLRPGRADMVGRGCQAIECSMKK